jgi:hypothetical protein
MSDVRAGASGAGNGRHTPLEALGASERNGFEAMSRLLAAPPPLAPVHLACGTQLTRRWLREGFNGYAPGMAGTWWRPITRGSSIALGRARAAG